jgi:hypothetical protein
MFLKKKKFAPPSKRPSTTLRLPCTWGLGTIVYRVRHPYFLQSDNLQLTQLTESPATQVLTLPLLLILPAGQV